MKVLKFKQLTNDLNPESGVRVAVSKNEAHQHPLDYHNITITYEGIFREIPKDFEGIKVKDIWALEDDFTLEGIDSFSNQIYDFKNLTIEDNHVYLLP